MEEPLSADEFYSQAAAKGLALQTAPVVPNGLFTAYLRNECSDVLCGYGALVFLAEQGDNSGFVRVCNNLSAYVNGIIGDDDEPYRQQRYKVPRESLHFNAFEPTIPWMQNLDDATVGRLEELCGEVIGNAHAFSVHFRGIISTENSLLACGYAEQPLADIRQQFTQRLAQYPTDLGIPQCMVPNTYQTEKNSGITAPLTLVRLQGPLRDPKAYVNRVKRVCDKEIGVVGITQISFVYHGWHNNPLQRNNIKTYTLL